MSAELEVDRGLVEWVPARGERATRLVLGSLGVVGFLLGWTAVAGRTSAIVLPSPGAVAAVFVAQLRSGTMLVAVGHSLVHWVPGLVVGTTLGVAVGVLLGWSTTADAVAAPLVRLLRPVPPLALIGFAIAWFGLTDAGAAFIIAVGSFWINVYAASGGVESVPPALLDAARTSGVHSDLGLVRHVVLPSAAPGILTGVRTAVGRSWMLVIAAELISVPGVGRQIVVASNNLATDVVIAYLVVMSLVYVVVDVGFRAVEGHLLRWRD